MIWNSLLSKVTSSVSLTGSFTSSSVASAVFRLTASVSGTAGNNAMSETGTSFSLLSGLSGGNDTVTMVDYVIEIPRQDLTNSSNVIHNRFSAPGGPEVNSRGYRDIATGEYSVYNALNYRNLLRS